MSKRKGVALFTLALGFLSMPIIISAGILKPVGIASYAPILSTQSPVSRISGSYAGSVQSLGNSTMDIGLIAVVIVIFAVLLTNNKIKKKIEGWM